MNRYKDAGALCPASFLRPGRRRHPNISDRIARLRDQRYQNKRYCDDRKNENSTQKYKNRVSNIHSARNRYDVEPVPGCESVVFIRKSSPCLKYPIKIKERNEQEPDCLSRRDGSYSVLD